MGRKQWNGEYLRVMKTRDNPALFSQNPAEDGPIESSHTGATDGRRISIYRTGPYVWVLFKNNSGTPKYLNETVATYDRKFMKGDVITISAKAPEAGKRFTHWTWECVDKNGQQVEMEFTDHDFYVFKDSERDDILCVIYRREAGGYGVLAVLETV